MLLRRLSTCHRIHSRTHHLSLGAQRDRLRSSRAASRSTGRCAERSSEERLRTSAWRASEGLCSIRSLDIVTSLIGRSFMPRAPTDRHELHGMPLRACRWRPPSRLPSRPRERFLRSCSLTAARAGAPARRREPSATFPRQHRNAGRLPIREAQDCQSGGEQDAPGTSVGHRCGALGPEEGGAFPARPTLMDGDARSRQSGMGERGALAPSSLSMLRQVLQGRRTGAKPGRARSSGLECRIRRCQRWTINQQMPSPRQVSGTPPGTRPRARAKIRGVRSHGGIVG